MLQTIITGLCGAGWLATLIMYFIDRKDKRKADNDSTKNELKEINERLDKSEKDSVRIQLLLLMKDYDPKDESELLKCAQHYFVDLRGNWWITPKFNRFIEREGIARPDWLDQ